MSRTRKVLTSMLTVILIAVLAVPTTVSAKSLGQCQTCKQGSMNYAGRSPLVEMMACFEYKYETRYGPNGQYTVKVRYDFHYEYDYYYCSHCHCEKKVRVKVYTGKTVVS